MDDVVKKSLHDILTAIDEVESFLVISQNCLMSFAETSA